MCPRHRARQSAEAALTAAPQVEAFLLEQAPPAPEEAAEEEEEEEDAGCAVRAARDSRGNASALRREAWRLTA